MSWKKLPSNWILKDVDWVWLLHRCNGLLRFLLKFRSVRMLNMMICTGNCSLWHGILLNSYWKLAPFVLSWAALTHFGKWQRPWTFSTYILNTWFLSFNQWIVWKKRMTFYIRDTWGWKWSTQIYTVSRYVCVLCVLPCTMLTKHHDTNAETKTCQIFIQIQELHCIYTVKT